MSFGLSMIERETPLKPWMANYKFVLIQTIADLEDLIQKCISAPYCAFDLESTGLDTRVFETGPKCRVVGYSIAFESDTCYYIPIRHKVETARGKNLPLAETNVLIQKLLNEAVVVGHNWLKFDAEMMLSSDGIKIKKFKTGEEITYHDSYILARLAGCKPAGLKDLSKKLLNKEMIGITEVVTDAKDVDFGSVSPYEGLIYAASDAICTKEIFEHPLIQAPITEQKFTYNLERKLIYAVRNMERNKIRLNVDFCKELDSELIGRISACVKLASKLVQEKTNGALKEFKLDSPAEVADVLFNIFDMNPKPEKGKNGSYTTDDATLETLAKEYELAKVLQDYRTLTKFHRTYIKNMLINVDEDGYLKFQFSALQTDTGRFASPGGGKKNDGCSGVNIQSTPARYDKSKPNVRKCLSGDSDEVIVAMDWAGVELRVAANMSLEPIWLERFLNGDGDLHTSTASIIYDKPESDVDKEERQTGKTFNFQSVYGGGPGALASTIGISIDDAKEKQQRFFGRLQTLRNFIKSLQKTAQKSQFSLTKFGRKALLPEYTSEFPKIRNSADRKAVNYPIQGTAADLMKLAMVKIDDYIEENNLRDYVKMVLTMHDELCFRIKKTHIDRIPEIEEVMKLKSVLDKIGWKVPLAVDVEIGDSWDIQYQYKDMLEYLQETYGPDTKVTHIYKTGEDYQAHLDGFNAWEKAKKEAKKAKELIPAVKISISDKARDDFKKMGNVVSNKSFENKPIEVKTSIENVSEISHSLITAEAEVRTPIDRVDLDSPALEAVEIKEEVDQSIIIPDIKKEVELSDGFPIFKEDPVKSDEGKPASANDLDKAFKVLKSAALSDLPLEAHIKLKKAFYQEEIERILSGSPSNEDEGIEMPIVVHNPIDEMKKSYMGVILDTCKGRGKIKFVTTDKQELHEGWFEVDILKASIMAKIFNL